MATRGSHFDVDRAELESVFKQLDQFRSISDRHERIMNMAAWVLYGISNSRPFFNGNKRSASVACVRFLNANDYDILIELLDIKKEMYELLTGVQKGSHEFRDVKTFMRRRAVTFRSL